MVYILLSGTMPFSIRNHKHVLTGNFQFPDERWTTVSDSAKDLIRKLLNVDPSERFTADQALEHDWLRNVGSAGAEKAYTSVAIAPGMTASENSNNKTDADLIGNNGSTSVQVINANSGSSHGSNMDIKKRKSGQSIEEGSLGHTTSSKHVNEESVSNSDVVMSGGTVKKERSHDSGSLQNASNSTPGDLTQIYLLYGNLLPCANFAVVQL